MEKMMWTKPEMNENVFPANAYCGTCGLNGVTYKFECNAGIKLWGYDPRDSRYGWVGKIFKEINSLAGLQSEWTKVDGEWYEPDEDLGGYQACNEKHTTNSGDVFSDGYYVKSNNGYSGYGGYDYTKVHSVKIWRGDGDLHATDNLDIDNWETAKS